VVAPAASLGRAGEDARHVIVDDGQAEGPVVGIHEDLRDARVGAASEPAPEGGANGRAFGFESQGMIGSAALRDIERDLGAREHGPGVAGLDGDAFGDGGLVETLGIGACAPQAGVFALELPDALTQASVFGSEIGQLVGARPEWGERDGEGGSENDAVHEGRSYDFFVDSARPPRMPLKVMQWGTGNVGRFAIRSIVEHPELELSGVVVHGAGKVGKDAGEIAGIAPTGVRATQDVDAALASDADCVVYTATADLRPFEAVDDLCRILRAGKNVVSSSVVALVHPRSFVPEQRAKLEAAAREGGASLFTSGIDPGFANDVLPLVLSGLACRWREVRVLEIINYATYDQPQVLFDTMGFGKPLDHVPLLLLPGSLAFAWGGTVHMLAEGLGLTLDEVREVHERRPATKPIRIGEHVVEPGTMAALRFEVQGIVDGKPVIVVEHVTRLDDDLAPEWPTGNGSYRVVISGYPTMRCEFEFEDEQGDHAVGGVILTATRIVNAIPFVCAAPPGLLSALDLPLITGKGLLQR